MKFAVLGSGSSGNAYLVEAGETLLLIDAGFSRRELGRRLALLGRSLQQVSALLITHEHSDHCSAVPQLLKREHFPLLATPGTLGRLGLEGNGRIVPLDGRPLDMGDLRVLPFDVSHDAAEPVGFVFESPEGRRLGLAADLGTVTALVLHRLQGCHALALEHNHDEEKLRTGPYPFELQRRIRGNHGHLSNAQAGRALPNLLHGGLRALFPIHLSEINNDPILVKYGVSEVLSRQSGPPIQCFLTSQHEVLPFWEV
jgi:phosphoribosyl 1,2-cyclic phosphodiesterase